MNLESLKAYQAKVCKVTLEDGSEWTVRKLSAAMSITLSNTFKSAGHTDPNGPEPSEAELLKTFALFLSKALCDDAGVLVFDNDEGRLELQNLDFGTIQELTFKVQGLSSAAAKKN